MALFHKYTQNSKRYPKYKVKLLGEGNNRNNAVVDSSKTAQCSVVIRVSDMK